MVSPIKRIAGNDSVMPYYKLENEFLVKANDIYETVINVMENENV